jgi:hypothetical protein
VQHSFRGFFYDYCEKKGHQEAIYFCQVPKMGTTSITLAKFANIFRYPSTKSQGTSTFHLGFPHQG